MMASAGGRGVMAITIHRITYYVTTEADIICLVVALDTLQALARRKSAA